LRRNKFCFTGGYLESSVQLPGASNVLGLWPAIWTMGNLGRAGYGASLEGMVRLLTSGYLPVSALRYILQWPHTYDSCDVGTVMNQTINGQPFAATINGDKDQKGILSYLPGQRLSRCTCPGESHPGPMHRDGSYVGRSAPEIDVFEAQVSSCHFSFFQEFSRVPRHRSIKRHSYLKYHSQRSGRWVDLFLDGDVNS
jgi:Beta-glucanase/Beta-glucan synthetase